MNIGKWMVPLKISQYTSEKFIYLAIVIFFSSCINNDKLMLNSFKDVAGFLYYEKPETGPIVYAVFLPFAKNKARFNFKKLDFTDYKDGIKFGIAGNLIKDKLYSAKYQKLTLKGGVDRTVYLISNVNIYFHFDTSIFNEKNVVEKHFQMDTLVCMNEHMKFKYRFSWITLDSIKVN